MDQDFYFSTVRFGGFDKKEVLERLKDLVEDYEEQIEELKKAAEEFKEALQGGDLTEYAEADVKFHDIIYHATENQKLVQLLYNLREQMYRYRVEYLKRSEVHQTLLAEHQHIIDCIEKHDKEAAKMAIRAHIDNQFEKVANTIREKK